jgi:hypothetical protein
MFSHLFGRGFRIPLAVILAATIGLSNCTERPEYVRLPQQYQPTARKGFLPVVPLLTMGTSIAEENTIDGIFGNDSAWPWSNEHPRFLCFLRSGGSWQFVLQFAAAKTALRDTGPVTITVSINDMPFTKFVVSVDGTAEYVHDVPAKMALSGAVRVDLAIQPFWTSPKDGERLGVLIHSIGFRRRPG